MTSRREIVTVGEGYGEVEALPLLVDRWLRKRRFERFSSVRREALRAPGSSGIVSPLDADNQVGIEYFVDLAARLGADGILVVVDAEDYCRSPPGRSLGPELLARARSASRGVPVRVVVANREYEAWFLGSLKALRTSASIPWCPDAAWKDALAWMSSPESYRDCKGRLRRLLPGAGYQETVDQLAFTEALPLTASLASRSRSFKKLLADLEALCREMRARKKGGRPVISPGTHGP